MVGMGSRTLKTAIGAALAIWLAGMLQLQFSVFAAIIVIMCIERTKKRTVETILDKFFACLLSLIFSGLSFEFFGYSPVVFGIFIFLFIPILVQMKIQGGFVTSMVVVTHLYTLKEFNRTIILNELIIIAIGIGIAFLINSIMPNFKKEIKSYRGTIEDKFRIILFEFAAYLKDHNRNWDGKEFMEVEDLLIKAKQIVQQDVENHLLRSDKNDYFYLEMREDQFILLKRMLPIVSLIDEHVKQKEIFAEFLAFLSENVNDKDTTDHALLKLDECWQLIRETDLPKTREEFETRANLFHLMNEIENYLHIKKKLYA